MTRKKMNTNKTALEKVVEDDAIYIFDAHVCLTSFEKRFPCCHWGLPARTKDATWSSKEGVRKILNLTFINLMNFQGTASCIE